MSPRYVSIAFCILVIVATSRAQSPAPSRIPRISQAAEDRISGHFSPWMAQNQFTTFFRQQHNDGLFAFMVEGRLNRGQQEYRAIFDQFPVRNFSSFAAWGRGLQQYQNENSRFVAAGYDILSLQTFQDAAHTNIYQVVWVRKDEMPAARKLIERLLP
jgi:hypothetical protein